MKFPKTWNGWKMLFWITLRKCPKCHRFTITDPWSYGDPTRYCMPCDGLILSAGFFDALRKNAQAKAAEVGK